VRIVVSGTHGSGKSTLISDFAMTHPEFTVLPDPFELLDESDDVPSLALFASQLRIAADRLTIEPVVTDLIAERGPLDFLAYLLAQAGLTGRSLDDAFLERATARTAEALRAVDILVVLPLTTRDSIHVGADEYLELRDAMNDVLLELLDDPDIIGDDLTVAEITGAPAERLVALEALMADGIRRAP
jgi:hypothetical protein